jgi:hypothetical protein
MTVEAGVSLESRRSLKKPKLDVLDEHCGFGFAKKDEIEPQYRPHN